MDTDPTKTPPTNDDTDDTSAEREPAAEGDDSDEGIGPDDADTLTNAGEM